jgi:C4-dicarboxylate transporter DctM subunit
MVSGLAFVILLLLGIPIAFVMGLTPLVYFLVKGDLPGILFPQRMFSVTENFVLLAVPFFILAGSLMNQVGLTQQLVDLAKALVGHVRGGLGMSGVLAGMFFAGTTGSATAEAAALGSTLIPAMRKDGYDKEFAAAVVAASATIGPIIPPSITAVVYGVIAEVSVGALLLAGLIPGILMGSFQMIVVHVVARRRGYPAGQKVSWAATFRVFVAALPALVTPAIIMGGIVLGIFTPTEAGAIASAYALVLGLIYRKFTLRTLGKCLTETGILTASVMLILACASVLSWIIAVEKLPQVVAGQLFAFTANPYVILLLINLFLFLVGCFMDTAAAMILLVPVLAPVASVLGVHPVQFGTMFILNMVIGMATPPVGYALFIACSVGRISIDQIARAIWPLLIASIVVLALVTYVPQISLWFPSLFLTF